MTSSLSYTEENYLKSIYHLSKGGEETVNTNALAASMNTTAASTNDMVKRLAQKNLISHQKYKGAHLLPEGKKIALWIIRKHRLWEVFLVEKLDFKWDEVHEIAEQLEHIQSPSLIKRLDSFLGHPTIDPHGDPIPDENGEMKQMKKVPVSDVDTGVKGVIVSVSSDDAQLLKHLDEIGIHLGCKVTIIERTHFDGSVAIKVEDQQKQFISQIIAQNLMLTIVE